MLIASDQSCCLDQPPSSIAVLNCIRRCVSLLLLHLLSIHTLILNSVANCCEEIYINLVIEDLMQVLVARNLGCVTDKICRLLFDFIIEIGVQRSSC